MKGMGNVEQAIVQIIVVYGIGMSAYVVAMELVVQGMGIAVPEIVWMVTVAILLAVVLVMLVI